MVPPGETGQAGLAASGVRSWRLWGAEPQLFGQTRHETPDAACQVLCHSQGAQPEARGDSPG